MLRRESFDALYITVYPVYPALFGAGLKAEFRVPFVLDYQDPWVGAWGLSVGGGPGGTPDWKSRASRWLGTRLEPRAVSAADAIAAVSQGTIDGIVERIPAAARVPHGVIPLGFEPADFASLGNRPWSRAHFDPADGNVHLCYVGTLLPTGIETLRLLLRALERARRDDAAAARLRLHFFGTSNQSESAVYRVLPIARDCGVADAVTEQPSRLDYLDALTVLTHASGIVLLGSSERHYTASKLYPALLAKRPILALFHQQSSVVSILRDAASEPTVRVVTYADGPPDETHVHAGGLSFPRPGRVVRVSAGRRRARSRRRRIGTPARAPAGHGIRSGGAMSRPIRLTAVLTHPIQYYAPWFRHLHAHAPGIALTVVHAIQPTPEQQGVGFDRAFTWDIPLDRGLSLDHGASGPA